MHLLIFEKKRSKKLYELEKATSIRAGYKFGLTGAFILILNILIFNRIVVAQFTGSVAPTVTGSDFKTTFKLLQFHFHWGWNDYQGCLYYLFFS